MKIIIVSIIVADTKRKCYQRFDNINERSEMKIRENVNRYNDKHGARYVVHWGDDEDYLKQNGYAFAPDTYESMVNDYNSHLAAGNTPMQL